MGKEIYPSQEIEGTSSTIRLIARTTAPLNQENYTDEDWQTLNSATVIAGEAARSCYSSSVQTPIDYIEKSDQYRKVTNEVVESTKEAGHLTTRQHVHYTFSLEHVSRLAINFLHSYPFYNSEEMSQRYVSLSEQRSIFHRSGNTEIDVLQSEATNFLSDSYNHLSKLLIPTVAQLYLNRFPGKALPKWEKTVASECKKKSQEIARYLLPIGMPTNLQYTVSELTLIRLYHLSRSFPVQPEISNILDAMVKTVARVDPSILEEIGQPLSYSRSSFSPNHDFSDEFDVLVGEIPVLNKIIPPSEVICNSVRQVLGVSSKQLPDKEALALVLDPKNNKLLASIYGESVIDQLSQAVNQASFSALVSLSHTANYQLHRHRGLSHTTPLLLPIPRDNRDYIIPSILDSNQEAKEFYLSVLEEHTKVLHTLEQQGLPLEDLQYLLPNATRVRKSISGPLGPWLHFFRLRTCFNAQEEINTIAVSLVNQLIEADPALEPFLSRITPCSLRKQAGINPICPESTRYCGVRVWNYSIDNLPKRTI